MGDQLHRQKSVISLFDFSIHELVKCKELHIFGQQRVHLQGENGAGKTTLLRSILNKDMFYDGRIEIGNDIKLGYFSQEHETLTATEQVLSVFMQQTAISSESQARNILGTFLFTKDKVFSQVQFLSEGEKARLLLAILINQNVDFLLLDEPTNHLDLESREVLAEALQNYAGGFLVVSHDRYFLEQIGISRRLTISNKRLVDV